MSNSSLRVVILWSDVAEPPREPLNGPEDSLNALIARIQGQPLLPAYAPVGVTILAEDWANPRLERVEEFASSDAKPVSI
jgi:hypothetical protein